MKFIEASGVTLEQVKIDYSQEADSCSDDDMSQTLTISSDDAGSGKFFILKTDRWAISDIRELILTLEDFAERAGIPLESPVEEPPEEDEDLPKEKFSEINERAVKSYCLNPSGNTRKFKEPMTPIDRVISQLGWITGCDSEGRTLYRFSINECREILNDFLEAMDSNRYIEHNSHE